ncbi:unnamed protein product [Vitrella brassicaformis CCMP3155]|uniref:Uncharacterized protein n=1 Tax=Vitrella brassicaformis (strain CCMP3155) TaxID=1169540 RepID=A0A0G4EDC2_VITBC|nr:unnamed protein product [Vitrella brassicaformis CCMP3155]|eukprot:CEL93993.1 unnamed protein product [Vitrella brassicaformis CCMP3155]
MGYPTGNYPSQAGFTTTQHQRYQALSQNMMHLQQQQQQPYLQMPQQQQQQQQKPQAQPHAAQTQLQAQELTRTSAAHRAERASMGAPSRVGMGIGRAGAAAEGYARGAEGTAQGQREYRSAAITAKQTSDIHAGKQLKTLVTKPAPGGGGVPQRPIGAGGQTATPDDLLGSQQSWVDSSLMHLKMLVDARLAATEVGQVKRSYTAFLNALKSHIEEAQTWQHQTPRIVDRLSVVRASLKPMVTADLRDQFPTIYILTVRALNCIAAKAAECARPARPDGGDKAATQGAEGAEEPPAEDATNVDKQKYFYSTLMKLKLDLIDTERTRRDTMSDIWQHVLARGLPVSDYEKWCVAQLGGASAFKPNSWVAKKYGRPITSKAVEGYPPPPQQQQQQQQQQPPYVAPPQRPVTTSTTAGGQLSHTFAPGSFAAARAAWAGGDYGQQPQPSYHHPAAAAAAAAAAVEYPSSHHHQAAMGVGGYRGQVYGARR